MRKVCKTIPFCSQNMAYVVIMDPSAVNSGPVSYNHTWKYFLFVYHGIFVKSHRKKNNFGIIKDYTGQWRPRLGSLSKYVSNKKKKKWINKAWRPLLKSLCLCCFISPGQGGQKGNGFQFPCWVVMQ